MCFSTALLRDRVYIVKPMLPWAGWALTPPFHPYLTAVYLCCTCPGVTPGRRYLLSLPYEARTFLICSLSARIRGCPTRSRKYCTLSGRKCQIPLKNLLKMYILYGKKDSISCCLCYQSPLLEERVARRAGCGVAAEGGVIDGRYAAYTTSVTFGDSFSSRRSLCAFGANKRKQQFPFPYQITNSTKIIKNAKLNKLKVLI